MPIRDILTLRRGECKFGITDDTPFLFCGEPQAEGQVYCAGHCAVCYRGQGVDVSLLAGMIDNRDGTIRRAATDRPTVVPVDEEMRGGE